VLASPELLGQDSIPDPINLDTLSSLAAASDFAGLLRTHYPDTLSAILLSLHGRLSVCMAARCLINGGALTLTSLEAVITYLSATLLKDATSPLGPAAKQSCIFTLVKLRLRRMVLLRAAPEAAVASRSPGGIVTDLDAVPRLAKRAKWLLMPELQPETSEGAVCELRKLQELLLDYVAVNADIAEDVFSILSSGDSYPGRLSLQLICLPVMGLLYSALRDILKRFPTALIEYCRYILLSETVELRDWEWLHGEILALSRQQGAPPETASVYCEFLAFTADILAPEDFIEILPPDGNMQFYARFIERSYRQAPIRILKEMIVQRAAVLE